MGPQEISNISLLVCAALLILPLLLSILIRLKLIRETLFAAVRMSVQLFLMAIYLNYLFQWNNGLINSLWLLVMILVATFSVIKNSDLNRRIFLIPVFLSLTISVVFVLFYFNGLILRLEDILEAKYFIVIGGMLLGNSLRGNIIGISNFYKEMRRNEERYLYHLSTGATVLEASMPYLRNSLIAALKPNIASMATMGIVFIPGMMTGQILGGSAPITAIKYQIAIMITIFVIVSLTVTLTTLFTIRISFNDLGLLKPDVFKH
jgi:putative ABC transport system permease protein